MFEHFNYVGIVDTRGQTKNYLIVWTLRDGKRVGCNFLQRLLGDYVSGQRALKDRSPCMRPTKPAFPFFPDMILAQERRISSEVPQWREGWLRIEGSDSGEVCLLPGANEVRDFPFALIFLQFT